MKHILVTGANSLLATAVINKLLLNGMRVRGVVRRKSSYWGMLHSNLELTEGDFTKQQFIKQAIDGCDTIIHCAAITAQSASWQEYERVNIDATRQLLNEAENADINSFIYVSSANVFTYGNKETPGDESKPICPPFDNSLYAKSKFMAQQLVLNHSGKMRVISVAPTFMIGNCQKGSGAQRMVSMALGRRVIFYPLGGKNFVYVEDVAQGIIDAISFGQDKECYLLSGENLSYKEFFKRIKDIEQHRALFIPIPNILMRFVGKVGDILSALGIHTEITSTNMKILCIGNYYSFDKAKKRWGYSPQSIDTAICDAIDSLKR